MEELISFKEVEKKTEELKKRIDKLRKEYDYCDSNNPYRQSKVTQAIANLQKRIKKETGEDY